MKREPDRFIFETDDKAELMLCRVRDWNRTSNRNFALRSLVAEQNGVRVFTSPVITDTSPVITDAGIAYLVQAGRDAGWKVCYVVNVRPKGESPWVKAL